MSGKREQRPITPRDLRAMELAIGKAAMQSERALRGELALEFARIEDESKARDDRGEARLIEAARDLAALIAESRREPAVRSWRRWLPW